MDEVFEIIAQNRLAGVALAIVVGLYMAGEVEERLNRQPDAAANLFTAEMDPETEIIFLEKRLAILKRLQDEEITIEDLIFRLEQENSELKAQIAQLGGA